MRTWSIKHHLNKSTKCRKTPSKNPAKEWRSFPWRYNTFVRPTGHRCRSCPPISKTNNNFSNYFIFQRYACFLIILYETKQMTPKIYPPPIYLPGIADAAGGIELTYWEIGNVRRNLTYNPTSPAFRRTYLRAVCNNTFQFWINYAFVMFRCFPLWA